ncbi:MAG: zinc-ribbon domain-containing protein [Clostridia bacterium]|nr:zinc-ribbon domain-containing protein [Clostridia bacterium]
MICKNCGALIEDEITVCPECGTAVEENEGGEIVAAKDPGKALGIISLILGIVGVVASPCTCTCFGGFLPFVASIVGIILGVIGGKKSTAAGFSNKLAKIGMILSIVGVVLFVALLIVIIIFNGASFLTGFAMPSN